MGLLTIIIGYIRENLQYLVFAKHHQYIVSAKIINISFSQISSIQVRPVFLEGRTASGNSQWTPVLARRDETAAAGWSKRVGANRPFSFMEPMRKLQKSDAFVTAGVVSRSVTSSRIEMSATNF